MKLIPRRWVIEEYVRYDAQKKSRTIPDFATWDWNSADNLDQRLTEAGFKSGIVAGFLWWKPIELGHFALSQCAIFGDVFPNLPRTLGQLSDSEAFRAWRPDREVEWFERLQTGCDYPRAWPLILRPAIKCEAPAIWYVEDGSGRAICFFRCLHQSSDNTKKAFGYLGTVPDHDSAFMHQSFPSLLASAS